MLVTLTLGEVLVEPGKISSPTMLPPGPPAPPTPPNRNEKPEAAFERAVNVTLASAPPLMRVMSMFAMGQGAVHPEKSVPAGSRKIWPSSAADATGTHAIKATANTVTAAKILARFI